METTRDLISAQGLRVFVTTVFSKCGLPEAAAAVVADVLVDADLRGVSSHGVALLERNVRRIRSGSAKARPEIRVVRDQGPTALLDGDGGLGFVVAHRAMTLTMEKAAKHAVGVVGVRNANHFGAAGYYASMAAERGVIGLVASNAASIMAPPGGVTAVVGNNPLAVAVPGGVEGTLLVDMALSVVSYNRVRQAANRGEKIPLGWAMDKRGEPTEDAKAALEGLLVPIGGHKGFALALILEVLTGPLTGGFFPWEVLERGHQGMGLFFLAIDPAAFLPAAEFRARVDELVRRIHSSEKQPDVERIFAPGERSALTRRERQTHGIPVSTLPWADLVRLAQEFQVALPA